MSPCLKLLITDEWDSNSTQMPAAFYDLREYEDCLKINQQAMAGEWGSLLASKMQLVQVNDDEDNEILDAILLWEWTRG